MHIVRLCNCCKQATAAGKELMRAVLLALATASDIPSFPHFRTSPLGSNKPFQQMTFELGLELDQKPRCAR